VERIDISEIGDYTGSLFPLSEFVLAPKIAGRLEKIPVNIGDVVRSGDLVAALDDEEYRQQVSQAKAELEVAQASLQEVRSTLENARREFERTEELRKKKIASESQRDAAEAQFTSQQAKMKVAQAQVSQKEAAFKIANLRLLYTQIRVPNNGGTDRVVGERFVDEGALLAANTPIVSILNIRRLIAVIHVIEKDYFKLNPGQQAMITTDALPGKTFKGEVVRIAPLLKEKSREARVEIEIDNPGMTLKPGMFVRLQILYAVHTDTLTVPVACLVKRDNIQGLFQIDRTSHQARFVPVTVGIVQGDRAEILSPILSDEVVTLGSHLLEDGTSVLLPDTAKERPARAKAGAQAGQP
jgi:RND family efflux transporter MFP subunit